MAADQQTVSRERISPGRYWNICTGRLLPLPGSETQTINGGQMVERCGRMVGELLGLAVVRLHTHTHRVFITCLFNFFGGERDKNLEKVQMCSDWHFLMRRDEPQKQPLPSPGPAPFSHHPLAETQLSPFFFPFLCGF